ncbi:MAG: hypothetical protein HUJ25_10995 [Crocinitomicaceae bacterium]|nr:hypothetical protein [Crocinitomicaceae bacterium]
MVFLIYGLTSLFQSGSFVTPIFLNQLILLAVAIVFYVMNRKEKHSAIIALYIFIQFLACLVDGFTVAFVSEKINSDVLIIVSETLWFGALFILCYFGYFIYLSIYSYQQHQSTAILIIKLGLIMGSLTLFFIPDLAVIRDVVFFIFLLFFFFSYLRIQTKTDRVTGVMAHQFLLLFFLEGLEYLH